MNKSSGKNPENKQSPTENPATQAQTPLDLQFLLHHGKRRTISKEPRSMEDLYCEKLDSFRSVLDTDAVGRFDFGRQWRFCAWQVEHLICSQNDNLENKPLEFLHMALEIVYS